MSMADSIAEKLTQAFAPIELVVEDQSARHAGHAGAPAGGESHFHVRIVTPAFAGLSRLERQRRIFAVLDAEMRGGIHALSLAALTPAEAA
jgi:BolA protein